ncbi:Elongation of fatty acids protein 3-like [Glycine soja]
MSLISVAIFTGMFSAQAEARDTRWLWRRSRTTSFEWLLCLPLRTRPSGRVFFWSYVFYLSRFLHLLRRFASPKVVVFQAVQQLRPFDHVVSMARVFTVSSGAGDSVLHGGLFRRLCVPVLDGNRVEWCNFNVYFKIFVKRFN